MVLERNNNYELIGVVYWGESCGRIPDVYANVRGKTEFILPHQTLFLLLLFRASPFFYQQISWSRRYFDQILIFLVTSGTCTIAKIKLYKRVCACFFTIHFNVIFLLFQAYMEWFLPIIGLPKCPRAH